MIERSSLPGKDPFHVPAQRLYKRRDDRHKQDVLNCAVEIHNWSRNARCALSPFLKAF